MHSTKRKKKFGGFLNERNIRLFVQSAFLLLILLIGYEFYGFVRYCQSGGTTPYFERPPGVEGFLPISSLMGIKYFLQSGDFNTIHPAGMVLFFTFFIIALFLKKGFCGWICPIGFLSEYLGKLGDKIFGHTFNLPRWLDYPLRSLKYLLMLFFVWAIITMSAEDLKAFIYGNYNKFADVMMLMFFVNISAFSLGVIIVLALLSLFIKNFWCRYLCPYGAFLGFFSIFSPLKITRNPETCTDCRHCTKACPQNIQVHSKIRIRSDECMACYQCVLACPETDTLKMRLSKKSKKEIPAKLYAAIIVGIFLLFTGAAMVTGNWKNHIKKEEYLEWIPKLDTLNLQHTE